MGETYCGKTCENCIQKAYLDCPGCKPGPGNPFTGDCKLAGCCREKGHESCKTCSFQSNCGNWLDHDRLPEKRLKRKQEEAEERTNMIQKSSFFGKWLWLLFWLIIPGSLSGILTNENILECFPSLYVSGQVLNVFCSVVYGLILLKLSAEEREYRPAGICCLIAGGVSAAAAWISGGSTEPSWTLVLTAPGAIISIIGEYKEYMAHAKILSDMDPLQSEKWHSLWKWYIGMFAAMLIGIISMLIIPLLGALVMLAAAIGTLAVSILKLVYLYRTAILFRNYADLKNKTG